MNEEQSGGISAWNATNTSDTFDEVGAQITFGTTLFEARPCMLPQTCDFVQSTVVAAFNDDELLVLKVVTVVSATASLLGSAFILLTFQMLRTSRGLNAHIVHALSIADLANSLVYIGSWSVISRDPDGSGGICETWICWWSAACQQLFGLGCILWTSVIGLHLHVTLLRGLRPHASRTTLSLLHLAVWGVGAASVLVLGLIGALGPAGQWCWISDDFQWARLAFFYLPLILAMGYNLWVYRTVRLLLHALSRAQEEGDAADAKLSESPVHTELRQRSRNYILVFGLINVFRLANRNVIAPEQPVFALYFLHSLTAPLQGVGNAIVYCWTPKVRHLYQRRFPAIARVLHCTEDDGLRKPGENGTPRLGWTGSGAPATNDAGSAPAKRGEGPTSAGRGGAAGPGHGACGAEL